MSNAYVIVPEEYMNEARYALRELGAWCPDIAYYGLDLLKGIPGMPSYAEALDELDLWHGVNIWSNAPVAIPTDGYDTQSLIDELPVGSPSWEEFVAVFVEEMANEQGCSYDEMLAKHKEPVSEDFKAIMQSLRDAYRLDNIV